MTPEKHKMYNKIILKLSLLFLRRKKREFHTANSGAADSLISFTMLAAVE